MQHLTEKQKKFCHEYVINGKNVIQAGLAAGYGEQYAKGDLYNMLSTPLVSEEIELLQKKNNRIVNYQVHDSFSVFNKLQEEALEVILNIKREAINAGMPVSSSCKKIILDAVRTATKIEEDKGKLVGLYTMPDVKQQNNTTNNISMQVSEEELVKIKADTKAMIERITGKDDIIIDI